MGGKAALSDFTFEIFKHYKGLKVYLASTKELV